MINILITGVAGFIGSNLAEKLLSNKNYNVIGIDNLAYGIKEQIPFGVKFYNADIRDKSIYPLFIDVDFVFHFAAKNCISDCQLDPLETANINIYGTINVFEASRLAKVKKVIYAESSAMYEGSLKIPTPETEVHPQSFYAISKHSTMLFAEAYSRYFNLNSTALRYFCVYGPKQDYRRTIPPLFSSFIIKILKNEAPIIYGNGEKRRDFIHIDDINKFHILCMENSNTDNKVFNLGSGFNYSVNDIYKLISKKLNSTISPIYKDNIAGEAQENLSDNTNANIIGWKPEMNIEQGLETMIDYIKNEMEQKKIL